MNRENTTYGLIKDIIYEETKYLRHYWAEVVNNVDQDSLGRVQVTIPVLGYDTPDKGLWAYPRTRHSMDVPDIGEYVEVYFLEGDISKPVYLGQCAELADQIPSQFDGLPTTQVLFESPKKGSYIKHDDLLGKFIIDFLLLELGDGATEPGVLGNKLLTWITNHVNTVFNTHTHSVPGITSGPSSTTTLVPSSPGTVPTDILSSKVTLK